MFPQASAQIALALPSAVSGFCGVSCFTRDSGMNFQVVEQSKPLTVPPDLREILTSMPLEYGTGGGVHAELPAFRLWTVVDDGVTAGYAWLSRHNGPDGMEYHVNLATLPDHKGCGVASFALVSIEQIMQNDHVPTLYCQVNSNMTESGLWVRQWLLRRGFELVRRDIPERYARLGDAEVASAYPLPIYFRKLLQR